MGATQPQVTIHRAEPAWPLYAVLVASLSIVVGLIWDISWHRTIGRDSFWSPPHVLEQLAAVIAGLSCGWIALRTTFGRDSAARGAAVRFWGFYGPLGGWVCIWGTLMMITSAPFDDWWHNAYGLDVRIISPPHMVLAWGMIAIQIGAMLTALARQNRAPLPQAGSQQLGYLYIGAAAILLTMHATILMEEARFPHLMHAARFYQVTALFFPMALVAMAVPSRLRWPATIAAALYFGVDLTIMWILQLMPAEPMLAPIYNPVTRMVPQPFPLLLFIPAAGIDLVRQRIADRGWKAAAISGVVFVALMVIAQWLLAEFLLSPGARNFFFGADQWDYNIQVGGWRYDWWMLDVDASGAWSPLRFAGGIAVAMLIATISARAGFWLGRAMSRVQR